MDVQPHRAAQTVGTCPIRCISRESGTAAVPKPPSSCHPLGTITLWRYLYQPLHGVEPLIFPLEIRLGLEVGLATPALTSTSAKRRSRPARIASWSI